MDRQETRVYQSDSNDLSHGDDMHTNASFCRLHMPEGAFSKTEA